jgi:MFS family permease
MANIIEKGCAHGPSHPTSSPVLRLVYCGHDLLYGPGEFGWNRGTISLAAAIGALVSGLSQPFLGRLYDRLGGRRLILASLIVSGVCTMLLALTTHILVLILLFAIAGLLLFGASLVSFAIREQWYSTRYQTAASAAGD